jgi:hypothetical protein
LENITQFYFSKAKNARKGYKNKSFQFIFFSEQLKIVFLIFPKASNHRTPSHSAIEKISVRLWGGHLSILTDFLAFIIYINIKDRKISVFKICFKNLEFSKF